MQPPTTLRVAFWNTWLLAPRMWPSGPRLPGGERLFFAPDVDLRAPLVGPALAGRFDVAALSEVFERSEHDAVARSWPGATLVEGPGRARFKRAASGLITFVDSARAQVTRSARIAYRSGGDLRDSDTFATKGALLTCVRLLDEVGRPLPDVPEVEVVSTHLFAGGELLPIPGSDDNGRHHQVRLRQLEELTAFAIQHHRPENVLVVCGDMNVCAHDPDPNVAHDPTLRYREMRERLAPLEVVDVWAEHGVGPGHTCTFHHAFDLPSDPEHPDRVVDRAGEDEVAAPGERIDYLFVAQPEGRPITIGRPHRWAFHDRPAKGGPAGSLSDHLAISVDLDLAGPPRPGPA